MVWKDAHQTSILIIQENEVGVRKVERSIQFLFIFYLLFFLLMKMHWFKKYSPSGDPKQESKASLVAQMVKNLPAIWETQVRSLCQEHPLEKGLATHSSFLAWRIPRTKKLWGLQSMGLQRVRHDCESNTSTLKQD